MGERGHSPTAAILAIHIVELVAVAEETQTEIHTHRTHSKSQEPGARRQFPKQTVRQAVEQGA
jgi:hypothetical protein